MWRYLISKDKKTAGLKEINEYMDILANDRLLSALPEGTLIELHRAFGTAVSVIQHMEDGKTSWKSFHPIRLENERG
ncbi:MAG: hypothetical protein PVI53_09975 [Desulfobacteraceae bacterium]